MKVESNRSVLWIAWLLDGGGWMVWLVLLESLVFWGYLIVVRARAARSMEISPWYALITPLGAGVFAAMMITSAFRMLSGKGVSWKGRQYTSQ